MQVDRYEYDLMLKFDHNTNNYTQWFYFKVSNTRRFRQYQFNIINFVKPDSSFNDGMKPLIYSKKEVDSRQLGWQRAGEDISYYANTVSKQRFNGLPGPSGGGLTNPPS